MTCTWVDCTKEASHPHFGKDEKQWCNLCEDHHNELEGYMVNGEARQILSSWVKAQGGAKKATEAMRPEIERTTEIFGKIVEARKKFNTKGW
jgi:hypothetical protein